MNLNAETERDIILKYRETGNKNLLEPIMAYLYKIFNYKLNNYSGLYHLEQSDIVQELIIQALKCLESFDESSDIRFTSYAGGKTMVWRKLRDLRNKEKDHIVFNGEIRDNYQSGEGDPYYLVELQEIVDLADSKMNKHRKEILIRSFFGLESNTHKEYESEIRRIFKKQLTQGE